MAEQGTFDFDMMVRMTTTAWDEKAPFDEIDWDGMTERFTFSSANVEKEVICRHIMLTQVLHLNFPEGVDRRNLSNAVRSINGAAGVENMSPYELEKAMLDGASTGHITEMQPPAVTLNSSIEDRLKRLSWDCLYAYRGKLSWKPDESASFITWYNKVDQSDGDTSKAIMPANAKMCCWEGVFYALIKSNVLPWNALATSYYQHYTRGNKGPQPTKSIYDDLANFLAAKGRTVKDVVLDDANFSTQPFAVGDIVMNPASTKPLDPNAPLSDADKPDFIWHVGMICQAGIGGSAKVMHLHVHEYGASNGFVDIITVEAFGSYQFVAFKARPRIALFHMF